MKCRLCFSACCNKLHLHCGGAQGADQWSARTLYSTLVKRHAPPQTSCARLTPFSFDSAPPSTVTRRRSHPTMKPVTLLLGLIGLAGFAIDTVAALTASDIPACYVSSFYPSIHPSTVGANIFSANQYQCLTVMATSSACASTDTECLCRDVKSYRTSYVCLYPVCSKADLTSSPPPPLASSPPPASR